MPMLFIKDNFFKKNLSLFLPILLLDYILLFGIETVLPGFVMGVFNLNFLLLLILGILGFLIWSNPAVNVADSTKKNWKFSSLVFLVAGYFVLIMAVSLYKASFVQIAVYSLLAIIVALVSYKSIFNN